MVYFSLGYRKTMDFSCRVTDQISVGVVLFVFGMGFWICLKRLGSKTVGVEIGDSTSAGHV